MSKVVKIGTRVAGDIRYRRGWAAEARGRYSRWRLSHRRSRMLVPVNCYRSYTLRYKRCDGGGTGGGGGRRRRWRKKQKRTFYTYKTLHGYKPSRLWERRVSGGAVAFAKLPSCACQTKVVPRYSERKIIIFSFLSLCVRACMCVCLYCACNENWSFVKWTVESK